MLEYLMRMARYNQWANRRLFAQAAKLPAAEIAADRGAYFRSILGTLNHIYVADVLWLVRFGSSDACQPMLQPVGDIPAPTALDEIYFDSIDDFVGDRDRLDTLIMDFSRTWTDEMLAAVITYKTLAGDSMSQPLGQLLQHFFNHQTHHRGQATTLLFQAGIDPGPLDLLAMLREEGSAITLV